MPVFVDTTSGVDFLLVAEETVWPTGKLFKRLQALAEARFLEYRVLRMSDASWSQMAPILSSSGCEYFFFEGHGEVIWVDVFLPVTSLRISAVNPDGHPITLYAYRWPGAPASGSPDPFHPGYNVAYATELNREDYPFSLVWISACYSGRVGASREGEEMYSEYSCYAYQPDPAWNDMASAFGITPFATLVVPCGYVGWYGLCWMGDAGYGGGGVVPGMVYQAWELLANRFTFEHARDWLDSFDEFREFYDEPMPDRPVPGGDDWMKIAPFFNWRFWGNTLNPLFD
jgi:hypothetical protein